MRSSLIAAVLVVTAIAGPAAAKDWPRRQEEPPRNRGCEYMGPGYEKAPGSDTCIKVGGSVRVEGTVTINR